jgi:hypothetical protein
MRYLKLVILILAYALIPPAFAQTCCPAGCVQNAPNRCVTTGPVQNSCGNTFTCPPGSSGGSSGGSPGGQTYVVPQLPIQCEFLNPTKATVDAATNRCVNDLTGNAIFLGCFFEDDAGRAEDKRTGLTCPERQAALARQCLQRCAFYASASTLRWCVGMDPNSVWREVFGDISGEVIGSARVERCGPRLRSSIQLRQPSPVFRP